MVRWVILTILFFQLGAFEATARDFTSQVDFNGDFSQVITAEGEEGIKGTIGLLLPPDLKNNNNSNVEQPFQRDHRPSVCWFNVNHFESTKRCFRQLDQFTEFSSKHFLSQTSGEHIAYEKAFHSALVFALSYPKSEFSRQWSQSSRFQQDVYSMLEGLTLVRAVSSL